MTRAVEAQKVYATFTQAQVDKIFHDAAAAAAAARIPLAKMAVAETGMGVLEDKVIKNHFASEIVYNKYKNLKTCGLIEQDKQAGMHKVCWCVFLCCWERGKRVASFWCVRQTSPRLPVA
jgi:acetaldehyde dehydrogenase/alcohol dehydrogenase